MLSFEFSLSHYQLKSPHWGLYPLLLLSCVDSLKSAQPLNVNKSAESKEEKRRSDRGMKATTEWSVFSGLVEHWPSLIGNQTILSLQLYSRHHSLISNQIDCFVGYVNPIAVFSPGCLCFFFLSRVSVFFQMYFFLSRACAHSPSAPVQNSQWGLCMCVLILRLRISGTRRAL